MEKDLAIKSNISEPSFRTENMFTPIRPTLFLTAKQQRLLKCSAADKLNTVCPYDGILFGHKKGVKY